MIQINADAVLAVVASKLREVIGEDWATDITIDMDTLFNGELELESIEFVALGEQLTTCYGPQLDFARWLSSMELDQIIGLRVGQLVDYIVECTSTHETA
jgi:acyl carrier protein